jgi:hypothetical protein
MRPARWDMSPLREVGSCFEGDCDTSVYQSR